MISCVSTCILYLVLGWVTKFLPSSIIYDAKDMALFMVILVSLAYIFLLVTEYPDRYGLILVGAFSVRAVSWFIDLFSGISNPFSGGDSEWFWYDAIAVYQNGVAAIERGGIYSQLLGMFMHISYPEREYIQFSNVLFSSFVPVLVYQSMKLFEIREKYLTTALLLIAFAPVSWLLGGVLLREAWIQFFTIAGIYCFLRFLGESRMMYALAGMGLCLLACLLHAGMIAVVGFMGIFLLNSKNKTWALLLLVLVLSILCMLPDIFLRKFAMLGDIDRSVASINYDTGTIGSRYLSGIEINSLQTLICYAPLKFVYFVFTPFAWGIINFTYLLLFLGDALLFVLSAMLLARQRKMWWHDMRLRFLIFACCSAFFLFGIGTVAVGTAVRHRNKLFSVVILVTAVVASRRDYKRV